jgi:hypothetical protein
MRGQGEASRRAIERYMTTTSTCSDSSFSGGVRSWLTASMDGTCSYETRGTDGPAVGARQSSCRTRRIRAEADMSRVFWR